MWLILHRVSMGIFEALHGRRALFHGFHTPYYYFYLYTYYYYLYRRYLK